MRMEYYWNKLLKKIRGKAVKNSTIHKTSKIEAGSQVVNTQMDRYSFCGYDCKIINCEVGAFSSIADNVVIGGAQHPLKWVSTSPVFYAGKDSVKKKFSDFGRAEDPRTVVGNDVWIGERALIKGGITIGDGAVVGMGAVVIHDVKPYEIVAGVPAKHIGFRFGEEIIKQLIEVKWWDLSETIISKYANSIQNPELFLKELKICE